MILERVGLRRAALLLVLALASTGAAPAQQRNAADCQLFVFSRAGKYGYIDRAGREVVAPRFDSAAPFSDGVGLVVEAGRFGFVDAKGRIVYPEVKLEGEHDRFFDFSEGLSRFRVGGKFNQMTRSIHGSKSGYVDKKGRVVIKAELDGDRAPGFKEGLAVAAFDSKFGYIDKRGKFVIPPQYDDARQFSEGLALVRRGDKVGFIDRRGREVVALQYAFGESFSEGLASVMPHGATAWGYVDKTGKMVVESRFDRAKGFSEGLAAVEVRVTKGNRPAPLWGFIDRGGAWAVKPQYIDASRFSEGLANVRREDGWGFIDKTGNLVLAPAGLGYNGFAGDFCGGIAAAQWPTRYIDRTGKIIWTSKPNTAGEKD
jgi:hypothetical protein